MKEPFFQHIDPTWNCCPTIRTVEELACSLMRPLDTVLAAVLLISQSSELVGIISLRNMLPDVRLILILPATEHAMAANALPLRPRFVTYEDENSEEIIAVIAKLMRARQKQIPSFVRQ
ncbi:MAG: hypothetical protein AB9866_24275 [Syntrophobacteraceae bacterium]